MKDNKKCGIYFDYKISEVLHMVFCVAVFESGSHELSKRISSVTSEIYFDDSKFLFSKFEFLLGIKHILKIYEYSN